jgi:hypothetical protein
MSYSVSTFARIMKVSPGSVRYWLRMGYVPGAFQQGDDELMVKRWRIPEEAVTMPRPKAGRPFGKQVGQYRTKKSIQIEELKKELAELNHRHMKLMEDHAGLRGRYDMLETKYKRLLSETEILVE